MAQASRNPVEGTFVATGQSNSFISAHGFNLSLSGFGSATIRIERSFDKGTTWVVVKSYTADIEEVCDDPEVGVYYRVNCTVYTSGTIVYRISS